MYVDVCVSGRIPADDRGRPPPPARICALVNIYSSKMNSLFLESTTQLYICM